MTGTIQRGFRGTARTAVLTRTWSSEEAGEIVDLLQAHGIDSWTLTGVHTSVADAMGMASPIDIDVLVSDGDFEEAAGIVAEHSCEPAGGLDN